MKKLENSRTFKNVKKAFTEEAALVFRYLYCATLADFEGLEKHSALFREIAESGTSNVHGCFDFLKLAKDPDPEVHFGNTLRNLASLVQSETRQYNQTYPEMAKTAREEGLTDIASWFETLEKAKRFHVRKLKKLTHE